MNKDIKQKALEHYNKLADEAEAKKQKREAKIRETFESKVKQAIDSRDFKLCLNGEVSVEVFAPIKFFNLVIYDSEIKKHLPYVLDISQSLSTRSAYTLTFYLEDFFEYYGIE